MMRHARRALLLVAPFLLAPTATAYTECALGETVQRGNGRLMDCSGREASQWACNRASESEHAQGA